MVSSGKHARGKKSKKQLVGFAAVAAAVSLISRQQSASAATETWALAPADGSWVNAGNWTGGAPSNGDDLVFGSSSTLTTVNTNGSANDLSSVNSITFNSTASSFAVNAVDNTVPLSIGGATVGGITNNSTNSQTFNALLAITPGDNVTFTTNAATTIFLSNPNLFVVGATGTTSTLSYAGGGNISLGASMSLAAGSSFIENAVGTATIAQDLTLGGANTLTAGGGMLSISGNLIDAGGSTINVSSGSTLSVAGASPVFGSASNLNVAGTANFNANGASANFVGGNTISVTSTGELSAGGQYSGNGDGSNLTLGPGVSLVSAGTTTFSGGYRSTLTLSPGSSINVTGGTTNLGGGDHGGYVSGTAAGITVSGGLLILGGRNQHFSAPVSVVGGTLNLATTDAAGVSGGVYNTVYLGDSSPGSTNSATMITNSGYYRIYNSIVLPGQTSGTVTIQNPYWARYATSTTWTMNNGNLTLLNLDAGNHSFDVLNSFVSSSGSTLTIDNDGSANSLVDMATNTAGGGFAGTISVLSGILSLGGLDSSAPKSIYLANGSTLYSAQANINAPVTLGGGTVTVAGNYFGYPYGGTNAVFTAPISETSPTTLLVGNSGTGNGTAQTSLAATNLYTGGTIFQGDNRLGANHSSGNILTLSANNALGGGAGGVGGVLTIANVDTSQYPTFGAGNGAPLYTPYNNESGGIQLDGNISVAVKGVDNSAAGTDLGLITGTGSGTPKLVINTPAASASYYSGAIGGGNGGDEGLTGSPSIAVVKTGPGTQTLTGITSNYTGGTTIQQGVLQISDDRNLGSSSGGIVLDGGTLETNTGVTFSITSPDVMPSGSFSPVVNFYADGVLPKVYAGAQINSISVTSGGSGYTSPPTVSVNEGLHSGNEGATADTTVSGGSVSAVNPTNFVGTFPIVPTISFNGDGGGTGASAVVDSVSVGAIVQLSSGFGVSNAAVSTSDDTPETAIITNPVIPNSILLTSNGGTLQVDVGSSLTLTGLVSGPSNPLLSVTGGGTLIMSSAGTSSNLTYAGVTKIQNTTVSLTGASSLAGNSQVIVGTAAGDAAVFDISGFTQSTTYSINSGQTLSGHGTIVTGSNTLAIAGGATLQPGGTPGTLTVTGNLSVAGGSNLVYDMSDGGSSTAVSELMTFSGSTASPVSLSLSSLTAGTYDLFTFDTYSGDMGVITNDFTISPTDLGGMTPTITEVGGAGPGEIVLSVPEPASLSFLAIGGVGLLGRRRRKQKKA